MSTWSHISKVHLDAKHEPFLVTTRADALDRNASLPLPHSFNTGLTECVICVAQGAGKGSTMTSHWLAAGS